MVEMHFLSPVNPELVCSFADTNFSSGKSYLLLWLLIRRLAFELSTALQIGEGGALPFHEGGVHELALLGSDECYGWLLSFDRSRIWALVDSNQNPTKSGGVFINGPLFFVIERLLVARVFSGARKSTPNTST